MRRSLATIGFLLTLTGAAVFALAQSEADPEEPALAVRDEETLPGEAQLRASAGSPLRLGADQGNACICLCRTAGEPFEERWGYYERSIVSGCQWSGRLCVTAGELGKIGACTIAPAPLQD